MMFRAITSFLIVSVLGFLSPVMAQPPPPQQDAKIIEPRSAWVLQRRPDHCVLIRDFGTADRSVQMQIKQFPPFQGYEFIIAGRDVKVDRKDETVASFEPAAPFQVDVDDTYLIRSKIGTGVMFRGNTFLRQDEEEGSAPQIAVAGTRRAEMLENSDVFLLAGSVREPVRLRTGRMQKQFERLNNCVRDMLRSWGVDPERVKDIDRRPYATNLMEWGEKLYRSYPMSARMRGMQGTVTAILVIDQTGRPERCFTKVPLRDPTLQDNSCELLMEHGQFEPAKDDDGNPVKGLTQFTLTYQLN